MKTTTLLASLIGLIGFALLAQTNDVPTMTTTDENPFSPQFWQSVIAVVAPLLTWCLRLVAPKIPSALLPVSAPIFGLVVGAIIDWLASAHVGWIGSVLAGGAGVALREILNQSKKAMFPDPTPIQHPADK